MGSQHWDYIMCCKKPLKECFHLLEKFFRESNDEVWIWILYLKMRMSSSLSFKVDYQFIIKGYNSRMARCIGKVMEKGQALSISLWTNHRLWSVCVHQLRSPPNLIFLRFLLLLFCFDWGIVNVQYYISSRYATQWFTIFKGYCSHIVIIEYYM